MELTKTCPFCGGDDVDIEEMWNDKDKKYVECFDCHAMGPEKKTTDEAIEAWETMVLGLQMVNDKKIGVRVPHCESCGNEAFFTIRTNVITFVTSKGKLTTMFKSLVRCEACEYESGYATADTLEEAEAKALAQWAVRMGRW